MTALQIEQLKAEIAVYRAALTEIKEIADASEGVGFYAMLAERALQSAPERKEDK